MSEPFDPKTLVPPVYLGDAVYASWDGYQIWLHLDRHDNPGLIALDGETMASLEDYAARVRAAITQLRKET